ncbi:B-cell receptor CD22-like [Mytilus trossulus]|uniref:B-cell receptor CD22-like n=1 Tax=Mytilus trossulus TaxID=6551 RepID=UPI0030060591
MVLTIPGTYVMDILHGSIWQCYSLLENIISNSVLLDVNVPVSKVTLTATQSDENPIKVVSGSQQRFICTTDASRPAARIQWYLSGTNITDEASPQPSTCSAGCETVISSSVLSYIGNITDIGKIIYCTAANVEGQSVNSTMRSLDILYEPLIAQMPNINILEGNFLAVNCNVVSNPDPTYVWWTRQKEPGFRLNNANLTIINIHRNNSDSYTCHVMNILTPAGMSPQERTSQKMFDVNVQYEPEISQIPDFNITEGRTLTINSTTEANPDPIMVWWTRQNVLGLRYDGTVLSISSMQRQQSDIYTFHAMNILTPSGLPFQNRTSRKSFQINVQYPPTVNMYPGYNPYILYEGQQKIKLTCVILDANPTIDIIYNWTNAGAPISGKVINIKHVMRNISGQYSCSAINMIGISNTIWKRLDVQYQPEISDIQDYNVTEGNTLIIFPIISANPQPSLFWWSRPNEPEVVYNSSYLKISNILRKSSGYHTFHVRNTLTPSGMPLQERTSKKMFHVNVQYQPAISEIQDYNITEGHDLQIYPVIDANPEPTLLWWTSQNSFTYYGNSLTFTNVQRNSSGNYTCHVMNTLSPSGKSQQNRTSQNMFNVNVQYPPIIADINDINIMEGSSLAIYPVIDANPQSTSVWWSRQSEPYFRFYDTNFTISNIQKQSSGSYIFNAMNILTPSGMQQQKRTSQKMCYVNVQC